MFCIATTPFPRVSEADPGLTLVWNVNLAVPLVIAAAWEQPELRDFSAAGRGAREKESTRKFSICFSRS